MNAIRAKQFIAVVAVIVLVASTAVAAHHS